MLLLRLSGAASLPTLHLPLRLIPQSGRGPLAAASLGAGAALDAGVYPLWAANITGAGQVVGIGDTGLGECKG